MTPPVSNQSAEEAKQKQIQNVWIALHRITLKAINAEKLQNLIFIMVNDTFQVMKYDRAILFSKQKEKVKILGVSGLTDLNSQTEVTTRLRRAIQELKNYQEARLLTPEDFSSLKDWDYLQSLRASTVYWLPLKVENEELGLWLEIYDDPNLATKLFQNFSPLLKDFLTPAYVTAWKKFKHQPWRKASTYFNKKYIGLASLLLLALLTLIPVRLRIVAPCEVVAINPYVLTAPLDGIIEKVLVRPGEEIKKDQILYEYDKKVPYHKLQATVKDVQILQEELNQSYALATEMTEEATKLGYLNIKLKKSQDELKFIKRQINLLTGKSPLNGLVSMDNPDEWRGKPVRIGEKIMTISSKEETKVRIWIPEYDNINFDKKLPVSIFLNTIPTKTFQAKIIFISPEVQVAEGELPGYEAEAEWISQETPKLGLKGSAVLYGERVSILYYLLRKPISAIRKFMGV
ncbi:MAG: HlyD family efflux transporter periplasmic adaptor subunit [Candidatus Protochlamydia sp.]|nr:HlyD family efflux transporter periplasmic adaptor subunit [Candidatus Protochlamydia sp.]